MELKRVKELMEIERECVIRGSTCDRDCGKCDLVQDTEELLEAYKIVILELEERMLAIEALTNVFKHKENKNV